MAFCLIYKLINGELFYTGIIKKKTDVFSARVFHLINESTKIAKKKGSELKWKNKIVVNYFKYCFEYIFNINQLSRRHVSKR